MITQGLGMAQKTLPDNRKEKRVMCEPFRDAGRGGEGGRLTAIQDFGMVQRL